MSYKKYDIGKNVVFVEESGYMESEIMGVHIPLNQAFIGKIDGLDDFLFIRLFGCILSLNSFRLIDLNDAFVKDYRPVNIEISIKFKHI